MTSNIKVASRYAKTLLDLSIENKELNKTLADINFLTQCTKESKELELLISSPFFKKNIKEKCLIAILKKNRYPKSTIFLPFIKLLLRKKRENILSVVCSQFMKMYYNHQNICITTLTTASKPSKNVVHEMKKFIKKITKSKEQIINNIIDASIIGGFILEFEDKVLDTSIKNKINNLRLNIID